ncbi:hypothetical protein [Paenibacillus thiaminolyticus]
MFLASGAADYINGVVIEVNGGLSIWQGNEALA